MKMKKVGFALCAVSAYLVLVVAITLFDSSPVAGKSGSLVAGPNVRVINSSAEPVPVFDVDNPAFQPFQVNFPASSDPFPPLAVPEGKRLVIEHVTSNAFSTGDVFWITVLTTAGGQFATHLFPMSKLGVAPSGNNVYGMAAQTRIYADPGTNVNIQGDGLGAPGVSRFASISGYLVDVP